jgi:hypothetical protein
MATKVEKPLEASQLTHVADMPPLDVVTVGIPDREHLELPPGAPPAPPVARERRGRMWAWALAGVMGLLLVVAGIFAFTQYSSTGDVDLTVVPPVGSGVGEPASELPYAGLLEGPALPYMSVSIPEIPAIADVSVPSVPAISPMPAMEIPIPSISIPPMPAMSIPQIAEISFPSNPVTPPATPAPAFPIPSISVPSIAVPSIAPIEFPSFPAIPAISVPTIPAIPSIPAISVPTIPAIPGISFPTFPAM